MLSKFKEHYLTFGSIRNTQRKLARVQRESAGRSLLYMANQTTPMQPTPAAPTSVPAVGMNTVQSAASR